MADTMNKTQVLETTINVLSEISVPVRYKEQIADRIEGAIRNIAIAIQMIKREEEMAKEQTENAEENKENSPAEADTMIGDLDIDGEEDKADLSPQD